MHNQMQPNEATTRCNIPRKELKNKMDTMAKTKDNSAKPYIGPGAYYARVSEIAFYTRITLREVTANLKSFRRFYDPPYIGQGD